jgi:hypothetical protein
MKKNGVIVLHDTNLHTMRWQSSIGVRSDAWTNCVAINTLRGKRIYLDHDEWNTIVPNIDAIVLDDDVEAMLYPLFINLTLPWSYELTEQDFNALLTHFNKHYSYNLVEIFVKSYIFYKEIFQEKKISKQALNANARLSEQINKLALVVSELDRKSRYPKWLINFLCCFVPKKESCREFRSKYSRGK